jgi:hypothetical protein
VYVQEAQPVVDKVNVHVPVPVLLAAVAKETVARVQDAVTVRVDIERHLGASEDQGG